MTVTIIRVIKSYDSTRMYQNKVRRASVILDLETRVHRLHCMSESIHELDKEAVDKNSLIEFLQLTKLLQSKKAKVQKIRSEFDKMLRQHDSKLRRASVTGSSLDRGLMLQQDDYIRIVGYFSLHMSPEELIARVQKLPQEMLQETQRLVNCLVLYVRIFHGNGQQHKIDDFIDNLNEFDPNITLLQFMDIPKMKPLLRNFSLHDLQKLALLIRAVLPHVKTPKESYMASMFSRVSNLYTKKKLVLIEQIVQGFANYQEICDELHTDRNTKHVLANLPTNTPLLQLLRTDVKEKFPTLDEYVQEVDSRAKWKVVAEAYCTLCTTIIHSVSVLAAFRSLLYSRELTEYKPEWSLLDIPDKAALNKFIASF